MPQKEYVIQTEHTSGSTAKHYHGVSISTLNDWAKNNIPSNAVVSSIQVYYRGKLSLGDTVFYVGFSKDSSTEPGYELINSSLTTSPKEWYGNIPTFSSTYPFNITSPSSSYSVISVYMNSGIIFKKFTCYSFKVIYTYSIPNYTLTVNAGTGGTVTGGGTYESGTSITITATASPYYKFKQWSDGDKNASRVVTVTGNKTYTAEFEPLECIVKVYCDPSESGEVCTVSGGGTYKYGDTITIQATDIPAYHEFYLWRVSHQRGTDYLYSASATLVLDDTILISEHLKDGAGIAIDCFLEHTGFHIKVNLSPDSSAGVVKYGECANIEGEEIFIVSGEVSADGFNVIYGLRDFTGLEAIPNKGYKFDRWEDGDTSNPRKLSVTKDATYTAYFKLNRIMGHIWISKKILYGFDEVKAILVDTTKVYG